MPTKKKCFAIIVGSGFSGSLLAWILQKHGRDCVLVDQAKHPRFAIGESSTPTADFLVRHLANRWGLKELAPLATYGTWQQHYPSLVCGKKRGFTYYHHLEGKAFEDDHSHTNSLIVAASQNDFKSDTHWLRSDIDQWLFQQAVHAGSCGMEETQLQSCVFESASHSWKAEVVGSEGQVHEIDCRWLIDATGGSHAMRRWTGTKSDSDWMRTRTSALFGHFRNVNPFACTTLSYQKDVHDLFDGDDSAQHHVVKEGWLWTLRFGNGITSLGIVTPEASYSRELREAKDYREHRESEDDREPNAIDRERIWNNWVERYPSVRQMVANAVRIEPQKGLGWMPRLSRCNDRANGPGWVSLPTAYGFVDPLHSSGIAHALSGVARLSEAFLGDEASVEHQICKYASDVKNELRWIDTFVGLCYRALPDFEVFLGMCGYYFASAIGFERDVAKDPMHWPRGYMLSDDALLRKEGELMWQKASSDKNVSLEQIRQSIAPWNDVGLFSDHLRNRLAHTAAAK